MTGCRFGGNDTAPGAGFVRMIRHSRAGGNPDRTAAIFKVSWSFKLRIPTFVGMTGCRSSWEWRGTEFVGMTWCRFVGMTWCEFVGMTWCRFMGEWRGAGFVRMRFVIPAQARIWAFNAKGNLSGLTEHQNWIPTFVGMTGCWDSLGMTGCRVRGNDGCRFVGMTGCRFVGMTGCEFPADGFVIPARAEI